MIAALGALFAGCTFANALDVCDRDRPAEHSANTRPEGRQRVGSDRAVVAMPHGGAFVAFASAVLADPADQLRSEVRGALLGVDGAPQPTAGAQGELTYEPAGGVPGDFAFRSQPSVVAPDREDGCGAIVFGLSDESSSRVVAQLIRGSGARLGSDEGLARLEVSPDEAPTCDALRGGPPTAPSACVTDPVAVALEPTRAPPESTRDFVVFWTRMRWDGGVPSSSVRARRIRARFDAPELLPPGELEVSPPGSLVLAISAVGLSGGRTLLLWQEQEVSGTVLTRAQPFDNDTLVAQGEEPWQLGRSDDGPPELSTLSAVHDGQRIFVAWTERGPGDVDRIVSRVVDEQGAPLDGGASRVLAVSAGVQGRPAVTALRSRPGFAVAWEAEGDAAHEDPSGRGIRMILLDEAGGPLFASLACDATDFQLNEELEGDHTTPSLTTLGDGTVMAVWTGTDISETGIRSRALRPDELLPLREESP